MTRMAANNTTQIGIIDRQRTGVIFFRTLTWKPKTIANEYSNDRTDMAARLRALRVVESHFCGSIIDLSGWYFCRNRATSEQLSIAVSGIADYGPRIADRALRMPVRGTRMGLSRLRTARANLHIPGIELFGNSAIMHEVAPKGGAA